MKRLLLLSLALAFSASLTPDLVAQGRGNTRSGENRSAEAQQRRGDFERDDRHERRERDDRAYKGKKNGPPFCSNGAGHPVHGRQWCYEKGYRVGNSRRHDDRRYEDRRDRERVTLGDIIFGRTRTSYPTDRRLSARDLDRLLGATTLSRIEREARRLGYSPNLSGRWQPGRSADRLHLYAGNHAFATLLDTNRDGRVDAVRFAD